MARDTVTLVKQRSGTDARGREQAYWYLRWHDPVGGKKRGKSIGRVDEIPVREARKKRDLFQAELERSPHRRNPDRSPRLGEYAKYFLDCKRDEGAAEGTIECYAYVIRLLEAFFGSERRLDLVKKSDARAFRTALIRGELRRVYTGSKKRYTLSRTTVEKHMRHARAFFEFAARDDNDIIDNNPFASVKGRPIPAKEWRPISIDEFWRLFDAAPGGYKALIAICRLAGLRRSDALNLRWSDVDLEGGMLQFTAIKTGRSQCLPICTELRGILRGMPRERLKVHERVVLQRVARGEATRDPDLVRTDNIGRTFKRICEAAGVPFYGDPCHTLRKSCINDWARQHPPNVVQEWAGHGSIVTTMKHYAKVGVDDVRRGQGSILGAQST